MDGFAEPSLLPLSSRPIVRTAHVRHDKANVLDDIAAALGPGPFAMVVLFVTADANFRSIVKLADAEFPDTIVMGCTTAGEIGSDGYTDSEIVAVGFPAHDFSVETVLVNDLNALDSQELVGRMIRTRRDLMHRQPDWRYEFAFLTVDGLSVKEDELVAALVGGLGPVPLFGGSAGDGRRFQETLVSLNGRVFGNAAVLSFVRTRCPVKVFSLDHLRPTNVRMVVTDAEPTRRIVRQINAEPAAREYARLLGKDPEQLSAFTFAAHPVVVRFGGTHHVRAIQRVLDNGDLVFFSAIDEGLVLALAEPADIAAHLERELQQLSNEQGPEAILACDCILRRVEAHQKQKTRAVSDILSRNRVVGFSTYGEQVNGMHVNHTMTGVAIYAPDPTE